MTIDKKMDYIVQDGYQNYIKNSDSITVPQKFKSRKNAAQTKLAYITDAEAKQLKKQNKGTPHKGPKGIPSYDDFDAAGNYRSGAAMSAAETGAKTERARADLRQAGISPQEAIGIRTGAVAAGARGSKAEERAARQAHPKAFRASRRGTGIGGLGGFLGGIGRGIMGIFGGVPGKLISGLSAARNWAKKRGQNIGEEVEEFGEHDNLMSYLNRNKKPDMSEFNNLGLLTDRVTPKYYNDLDNELALSTQGDATGGIGSDPEYDVNMEPYRNPPSSEYEGINFNNANIPIGAPEGIDESALGYLSGKGINFNQGGRVGYQGGELVEQETDFIQGPQGGEEFQETVVEGQEQPSREQLEALAMEIFQLPLEELDEQQLLVVYQEAMQGQPMEEAVQEEDIQFAAQGGLAGLL